MEGFPEVVTLARREAVSRGHPRQRPSVGRQRWRSHSLGTRRDSTVTLDSAGRCGCGGTRREEPRPGCVWRTWGATDCSLGPRGTRTQDSRGWWQASTRRTWKRVCRGAHRTGMQMRGACISEHANEHANEHRGHVEPGAWGVLPGSLPMRLMTRPPQVPCAWTCRPTWGGSGCGEGLSASGVRGSGCVSGPAPCGHLCGEECVCV